MARQLPPPLLKGEKPVEINAFKWKGGIDETICGMAAFATTTNNGVMNILDTFRWFSISFSISSPR